MKHLVKATSILSMVSMSEMILRFVRTKVVAILLGPAGTGFVSALTLLLDTLMVAGSLGTRRAVVKQIAEANKEGRDSLRYREAIRSSFFLVFVTTSLVFVCVCLFSGTIARKLLGSSEYFGYVIAVAFTLPAASFASLLGAIFKGNLNYMPFAKNVVTAHAVTFMATPFLVYFFGLWGAIITQTLFYLLPVLAHILYNARHPFLRFSEKMNWKLMKEQCADGFNFMYGETLNSSLRLVVVSWITQSLGLAQMGIYQVVLTLTTVYMGIPMGAVNGYTLPVIAQAENNEKIIKAVNDTMRLLFFVLMPVIAALMVWPELFINILYSEKFFVAAAPLRIQLIGTCFSIIAHALGSSLVARGKLKPLYWVATINGLVYIISAWFLFRIWQLNGVAVAFSLSVFSTCVLLWILVKHYFKMKLLRENKILLLLTVLWIALSYMSGALAWPYYSRIAVFIGIAPWFILSAKASEKEYLLKKVKGYFKK